MARTTINSQGVPAGTITASDLTFPLADFSSTGIDDNASSTSLTIDSSGNIAVTGTVDGRDLATDGTKLDGIEASADVTDATNVTAAGALMDSEVTNLAQVKAFDSSDYATAAQGTKADSALQNVVADTTPQLGGNLDVNGNAIVSASNGDIAITPDGSGKIILDGLNFPTADGSNGQVLQTDGNGQLSFANSSGGGDVVDDTTPQLGGNLDTNGSDIAFGDNDKALFGAGSDLQIYHDGSNSFATTTTGQLILSSSSSNVWMQGAEGGILNSDGSEYLIRATSNGSVKLFYDNVKKFETTSTGIDVTGNIAVSGTVDGRDLATDGTKLDGIATGADVTPSWVPSSDPSYLTSFDITTQTDSKYLRSDIDDQMLAQLYGGFGAVTTGGTTNWNDSTNARSGGGYTLLTGSASNGPGGSTYYHPFSFEYNSKNGNGNMTQLAIPYNGSSIWHRYRYSSSWSSWLQEWNSGNDGSGSGLDADTVDGVQASSFVRSDANDTIGGDITFNGGNNLFLNYNGSAGSPYIRFYTSGTANGYWQATSSGNVYLWNDRSSTGLRISGNSASTMQMYYNGAYHTLWNAANDGSGSGLDADTVDGVQASGLMQLGTSSTSTTTQVFSISAGQPMLWRDTNATNATSCNIYSYWYAQSSTLGYIGYGTSSNAYLYLSNASQGGIYLDSSSQTNTVINGYTVWHAGNDGSGSGLDADTVDGLNVAQSGANVIIRTQGNGYINHQSWIQVGNGTGLYCPNGAYLYNDTTYGWYARSPSASNSSIRLQLASSGTAVGWWYADSGYNQGFLTSGGGWSFKVDNSGNATATGNVTAYSDIRLKENIKPLQNSLAKILQLRGVEYTRKDSGSQEIGVIAQEVEEVLPEVVHISDATAEDDTEYTDIRSVDYGRMVSVLIEAMKEQQAQIEELKEIIKCQ